MGSHVEDRRLPPPRIVAWSSFRLLVSSAKHVYASAAARCRGWKHSITLYLKKVGKAKESSHVRDALAHFSSWPRPSQSKCLQCRIIYPCGTLSFISYICGVFFPQLNCGYTSVDEPFMWGCLPASQYFHRRRIRWTLGASDIMFTNP